MSNDVSEKVKEIAELSFLMDCVIESNALYDEGGNLVFLSDSGGVLAKELLAREILINTGQLEMLIKVDKGTYL